jgi:hypothetical protein
MQQLKSKRRAKVVAEDAKNMNSTAKDEEYFKRQTSYDERNKSMIQLNQNDEEAKLESILPPISQKD